jgi:hypothetical protein
MPLSAFAREAILPGALARCAQRERFDQGVDREVMACWCRAQACASPTIFLRFLSALKRHSTRGDSGLRFAGLEAWLGV